MRSLQRIIHLLHRDIRPDDPNQPGLNLTQDEDGFFGFEVEGPHRVIIETLVEGGDAANSQTETIAHQEFDFPDHASACRFLNRCARDEDKKPWDKPGSFIVSILWTGRKSSPSHHDILELAQPVAAPLSPTCPPDCGHSDAEHTAFDRGLHDGEDGAEGDDLPAEYRGQYDLTEAWLTGLSVGKINASVVGS